MSGYKAIIRLYSNYYNLKELILPGDINFLQLHKLIQKLFNFDDYHNYDFRIIGTTDDGEGAVLDEVKEILDCENLDNLKIKDYFDGYLPILYEYDFGDSWEIVIFITEEIKDYNNKTVLIENIEGEYNPREDIGGPMVFDEIMECLEESPEDIGDLLDDYGLTKKNLQGMKIGNKFKKGQRLRI